MTDEELADVLLEAYDRAKPGMWIDGWDDHTEKRSMQRVRQRWLQTVRDVRRRLESSQREQTAATILAALIREGGANFSDIPTAVALTDALRAELEK